MHRSYEQSKRSVARAHILGSKVALIIPNYNMPEATDAIVERIIESGDDKYVDFYIVDNGSDLKPPAKSTTLLLPKNSQTTGGFLAGLAAVDKSGIDYIAYCFMITSTRLLDGYVGFGDAASTFAIDSNVVGYSPCLTEESTTAWTHMKKRSVMEQGQNENLIVWQRSTWMIDNICAFWRKDWFDSIGWFDPHLSYAWGIDLETSWKARQQGKLILIDDYWRVHKTTNIGYDMGRMNMTAEERVNNARAEMARVLKSRYGDHWEDKMRNEFVTKDMR